MRFAALALLLVSCAPRGVVGPEPRSPAGGREIVGVGREQPESVEIGLATWYGPGLAGRLTASGERFDPALLTAAHRTLPFGTWVEVRRRDNSRSVRVRITDRGPFHKQRIIDLSRAAAEQLDMLRAGVVEVELRVLR